MNDNNTLVRKIRFSLSTLLLASLFVALFTALAPSSLLAQDDPPGRVGRLSFTDGSVSFQVQGDADWVQADPNRPLTTGDNIWADENSRAEVHIDSTAVRLSSQTGLSFLNLDDRTVQLQLPQGTIEVHLRQLSAGDAFEVDTPNLAFTLTRAGEYVISTDPDGTSTNITVREGEGQVTGGGDSWDLHSGQTYSFAGTDQLAYNAGAMPSYDDFETWCESRDQRENSSASAKYVSRDVDGYYDLDDYGDWSNDNDYGAVWYPRSVAVDWVPYHTGHWVFIAPWGWTWVDEEPWGFAPYHYGRWALIGTRWGWVPGPVVVRPVYAPALVGFVGGAGFGLSVSIGGGFTGMAWYPLGPRDVFVPAYRCSPRYVQVVNVTNTRVIDVAHVTTVYNTVVINHDSTHLNYTYAGNARAVTAVSRDTFVNARPVGRDAVRFNDTQIRSVHVVSNTAPAPVRSSYVSANAKIATAHPAVPFSQRPVVANLAPRVPVQTQRTTTSGGGARSFNQQGSSQSGPQANQGQPNRGPAGAPATSSAAPANGGAANSGFRGFNSTQNTPQGSSTAAPNNTSNENRNATMQPNAPRQSAPNNAAVSNSSGNSGGSPNGGSPANSGNSNNGFRSFSPPNGQATPNHTAPQTPGQSGGNSAVNDRGNTGGANNGGNRGSQDQNQSVRFSPPVRAHDDNYDVHPPLNQSKQDNAASGSNASSGANSNHSDAQPTQQQNNGSGSRQGSRQSKSSQGSGGSSNKR